VGLVKVPAGSLDRGAERGRAESSPTTVDQLRREDPLPALAFSTSFPRFLAIPAADHALSLAHRNRPTSPTAAPVGHPTGAGSLALSVARFCRPSGLTQRFDNPLARPEIPTIPG